MPRNSINSPLDPDAFEVAAPFASETHFADLSARPTLILDKNGFIIAVNAVAESLFQKSEKEMFGHRIFDVLSEEQRPIALQLHQEMLHSRKALSCAFKTPRQDGSEAVFQWDITPLLKPDGEIGAVLALGYDVTQSQRAEREGAALLAIASAVNSEQPLDDILLLVRNAIIEIGGFDRAGIWVLEGERIRGTWGTDEHGNLKDERGNYLPIEIIWFTENHGRFGSEHYYYKTTLESILKPNGVRAPVGIPYDAVRIALRVQSAFVGILCADNLVTNRPIREENIAALMALCEQSAIAINNAVLLHSQKQAETRRKQMMETLTAIGASLHLDDALRLVRDAVVEVAGFDRAGLFRVEGETVFGAWGTDLNGNRISEHHICVTPGKWEQFLNQLHAMQESYLVWEVEAWADNSIPATSPQKGTSFEKAVVPLKAGEELVAILFVDNLVTRRPIVSNDMETIVLFTALAGIAIHNVRLLEERGRVLERQSRLNAIASAMSQNTNLRDLLLMVRNATVEVAGFDRAGIWLYDKRRRLLTGTWGTDKHGAIEDNSTQTMAVDKLGADGILAVVMGLQPYVIHENYQETLGFEPEDAMFGVRAHIAFGIRAGEETLGILVADNLMTDRSITERDVHLVLPFVNQAALALRTAQLFEERARNQEREKRFAEIAHAIGSHTDLRDILLQIRNAVIEVGGFDRAGVWYYDPRKKLWIGAAGTDREGKWVDISDAPLSLEIWAYSGLDKVALGEEACHITPNATEAWGLQEEHSLFGVHYHAALCLKANDVPVGMVCVDNLLSDATITEADIALLLPFCEQAALAIRNAELLAERDSALEQQRSLAKLSTAIGAEMGLIDILRLAREALIEIGGFERAGIYLTDTKRGVLRGVWGTDIEGKIEDVSHHSVSLEHLAWMEQTERPKGERYFLIPNITEFSDLEMEDNVYGVKEIAFIPIHAGEEFVGVISVDNVLTNSPIIERDVQELLLFTNQLAVAIQRSRLFQELQQAQEALVHSERLRAVGELASGVAHNVNNILSVVLGYAELIQHNLHNAQEVGRCAETIERAALDGAEIVRRIQQFARRETAQAIKERLDLGEAVEEALEMTRPLWYHQPLGSGVSIELEKAITPDLRVYGVASEIREAVVNLIRNSLDAMPLGGTLTVLCGREGKEALLVVRDTGTGISEETKKRIFEPFFTTKRVGRGIGLGLPLVWGAVERHGGTLSVESAVGEGTVFQIALPLVEDTRLEAEAMQKPMPLSGCRLLVVDDEELVATSISMGLRNRGAQVEVALSAELALEILTHKSFNVIISDQGMPAMTGAELLERVREDYPRMKRVLLSGWGADLPDGADTNVAELVLMKPMRSDDLAQELNRLREASSNL